MREIKKFITFIIYKLYIYIFLGTPAVKWTALILKHSCTRSKSARTYKQEPHDCTLYTVYRVGNLSPAMGRGISSRNRVWNWVAKLHDNHMPTWFPNPIAGLRLPSLHGLITYIYCRYQSIGLLLFKIVLRKYLPDNLLFVSRSDFVCYILEAVNIMIPIRWFWY